MEDFSVGSEVREMPAHMAAWSGIVRGEGEKDGACRKQAWTGLSAYPCRAVPPVGN